ncbi:hypothetical protein MmiHf6_01200 [Methanimicrococcus hongohii]|uniref:Spore coat protein CotH n=1 Tax=Methanimicrococcus hongohii TaxID=3028295 RepID=A0AA96ZRZ0_9EURY|nr:CotH kinase family protein [Methanimicrococcus sp. Hf6]WNY22835.1 hypothetical protein MmiHf6_01200 [Methanimicrococcus sp. Hf6]
MSSPDKKSGFINSKYLNAATAVLVVLAVLLVCILMFNPSILGITSAGSHPEYEDEIFDQSMITSISIDISEENWAAILANPTAEEFYQANVTINGETFYAVGIRTKGMTSLSQVASSDSDRYSFKIKADKYVDGQTFFGLEEFVINNMYQDPSYMKEYLSYDMMDYIGVPTPLYNYAEITINGEYWGLYLAIEAVEEDFALRVYGSDYGQLYKPESMNGGGGGGNGGGERPDGGEMPDFENMDFGNMAAGDMTGMQDFGGFDPTAAGTTDAAADGTANTTTTTTTRQNPFGDGTTFAEGEMPTTGGGDMGGGGMGGGGGSFGGTGGGADLVYTDDEISSYSQIFDNAVFGNAQNSDFKRVITALKYLNAGEELETYVDVDGTLRYFAANTMLVNLDSYVSSLKHNYYLYEKNGQIVILPWDFNLAFGAFQSGSASSTINFPIDTPVSGVSLEERPLIGVLLADEEYMELYHSYLQEIVDGYFTSGYYDAKITELDALINESVKNDPTSFYTHDEYVTAVAALYVWGDLRAESVQGQLDGTVPSTDEAQSANPDALIDTSALNMNDLGGMNNMGRAEGRSERTTTTTDATQTAGTTATDAATATADAAAGQAPGMTQSADTNQFGGGRTRGAAPF